MLKITDLGYHWILSDVTAGVSVELSANLNIEKTNCLVLMLILILQIM